MAVVVNLDSNDRYAFGDRNDDLYGTPVFFGPTYNYDIRSDGNASNELLISGDNLMDLSTRVYERRIGDDAPSRYYFLAEANGVIDPFDLGNIGAGVSNNLINLNTNVSTVYFDAEAFDVDEDVDNVGRTLVVPTPESIEASVVS